VLPELAGHDDSKVSNADCYAFGALFSVGAPIECQYEFHRVFSVVVLRLVLSISRPPEIIASGQVLGESFSLSCQDLN
jgi:hypothetical protein